MTTVASSRDIAAAPADGLASWYTPSRVDGFGDRLLMFDNTDVSALELLRFDPALVATAGFEAAIRQRVRHLESLTHASFPRIRAVERLEGGARLALVSTYTPGARIGEWIGTQQSRRPFHPAFVTWLVREILEPLSFLQSSGPDFAHAALTADRIVITAEGQVRILEHVLGAGLRHLNLSPAELWTQFGLFVPLAREGGRPLDARTDVFQVAALGLAMLLGRPLTPWHLHTGLPQLLTEWADAARTRGISVEPLRGWIERALQVGDAPFNNAAEAYADAARLAPPSPARALALLREDDPDFFAERLPIPASAESDTPELDATAARRRMLPPAFTGVEGGSSSANSPMPSPATIGALNVSRHTFAPSRARSFPFWVAAVFATIAIMQAAALTTVLWRRASTPAAATRPPERLATANEPAPSLIAAQSPPPTNAGEHQAAVSPAGGDARASGLADATALAIARAARSQRSGGVRVLSPIEVKVIEGDRVLGSSADGPIVAAAGTHQLDFINTALGFRTRQVVTFRAGEIAPLNIAIPRGRLSINAQPWADVWIDEQSVGETPLANLDVTLGEHQVVFRHPDLGERRETVIVRADGTARVSAALDR
jgi:hypothetical protein